MSTQTLDPRRVSMSPATARGWPTELFVLKGTDRAGLRQRAVDLLNFMGSHSGVNVKDLAFTLASELVPGGERLTIVASSTSELEQRLRRALDRLNDSSCRQIRDTVGIYYFAEPLGTNGRVAVLFPGEGAHYLNMLGDLEAEFAEVRAFLRDCDDVTNRSGGGDRSAWRQLQLPPDADDTERREAEARLDHLGIAMCSVLAADWAMWVLLAQLGLKVDAVAGHSMGELAALSAGGAMVDTSLSIDLTPLRTWLDDMQAQESAGIENPVVLLAVAAGRARVSELIHKHRRSESRIYLAMDNCPHQSVVVGPMDIMAEIETALVSQGIICERLPFQRPYHTPLFRPSLADIEVAFAHIEFQPPRIPVYSCSIGQPFPREPEAIRRLMIDHWASPVEFTRVIENTYADGARLFVECGPRGNLTAFVEDILRGRPFCAVASNLANRSGLTQLNHLAGQLVAHHVPLQLEYLFRHRQPERVGGVTSVPANGASHTKAPARDHVMKRYLEVMNQFLEVQQQVVQGFLHRTRSPQVKTSRQERKASPPERGPFIGEVVRIVPGREVLLRRPLDLAEDLVIADHTLGGREVSKVNPDHHGVPIMPMTYILEVMAEAAALLAPGRVVTSIKGLKLFRWLAYDETSTIEIAATAQLADGRSPDDLCILVEIADPGSRTTSSRTVTARATVILSHRYPSAPSAKPFLLVNERPCRIPLAGLYRNLFHGRRFQGVLSSGRVGDEGIECPITVLPRHDHFASQREPRYLLDPVLLDVSMHPQVAWHLEQPDQSGRILLPVELASVDVFGPPLPEATRCLARCWIIDSSARHFTHHGEVIDPEGKIRYRLTGVRCWRFYVPFGEVNFHGPKDEYYLSRPFPRPESLASGRPAFADCPFNLAVTALDPPADIQQRALRTVTARVVLAPREVEQFRDLDVSETEKFAWLFRRVVAKDAVRLLWLKLHGRRLFPADIELELSEDQRGIARVLDAPADAQPLQVAVAEEKGRHVAVCSVADRLGIGLAKKDVKTENDARLAAAECALGQALGRPGEDVANPRLNDVAPAGRMLRLSLEGKDWLIGAACEEDWVVAIALGENDRS